MVVLYLTLQISKSTELNVEKVFSLVNSVLYSLSYSIDDRLHCND